jgi:hypothetical protein
MTAIRFMRTLRDIRKLIHFKAITRSHKGNYEQTKVHNTIPRHCFLSQQDKYDYALNIFNNKSPLKICHIFQCDHAEHFRLKCIGENKKLIKNTNAEKFSKTTD